MDRAEDVADELVRSAIRLVRSGSLVEAAARFDQALAFGDRCPHRSRALLESAQARIQLGELAEATALTETAMAAATAAGDEQVVMLALGTLGQIHRRRGDHATALTIACDGEERARRIGDDVERMTFAMDRSLALHASGDLDGALDAAVRAQAIAREHCGPHEQLRAAGRTGTILRVVGRLDEAEQAAVEGLRLARSLDDKAEEIAFLWDLGSLALLRDRPGDAVDAFHAAVTVAADTERWDGIAELVREIIRVCTSPAEAQVLWWASRAATMVALSCGPELRPEMQTVAMEAVLRAVPLSDTAAVGTGLVGVRKFLDLASSDPEHPTLVPLLDVGVTAVVRWYLGQDVAAELVPTLETRLGVAPLLSELLARPAPELPV